MVNGITCCHIAGCPIFPCSTADHLSQKQQQQQAANADGGSKKKKVTAAQLRVQKGWTGTLSTEHSATRAPSDAI